MMQTFEHAKFVSNPSHHYCNENISIDCNLIHWTCLFSNREDYQFEQKFRGIFKIKRACAGALPPSPYPPSHWLCSYILFPIPILSSNKIFPNFQWWFSVLAIELKPMSPATCQHATKPSKCNINVYKHSCGVLGGKFGSIKWSVNMSITIITLIIRRKWRTAK